MGRCTHARSAAAQRRVASTVIPLCLAALLAPTPALAHKVSLFATVEGDSVRAEAYFADGSPCAKAVVTVFDAAGEELASKETDSLGQTAFAKLSNEALKLVVYAGMGHRAEFGLTAEELGSASEGDTAPGTSGSGEPTRTGELGGAESAPGSPSVREHASAGKKEGGLATEAQTEFMGLLEASLDRRLAPLEASVRRLERAHEKAGVKDAVTGVGFIVGLAGLWALLTSRRKQGQ